MRYGGRGLAFYGERGARGPFKLGPMGEHVHVAEESISGPRREQRDGRWVAVYTYRCSCGETWEEAEDVLSQDE